MNHNITNNNIIGNTVMGDNVMCDNVMDDNVMVHNKVSNNEMDNNNIIGNTVMGDNVMVNNIVNNDEMDNNDKINNNGIKLIIDNRENAIIDIIEKDNQLKTIATVKYMNMDVGDISIKFNDKIVYLIERKTWSDLAASIKDGRYKSQKMRLSSYAINNKIPKTSIMYLIEGKQNNQKINGIALSILKSACINTQTRDGMRIYQTNDVIDTYVFLCKVCKCLKQYGSYKDRICDENMEDKIIKSHVPVKKKSGLTSENIYMHQLSIIPNVSIKTARAIMNTYSSMPILLKKFENNPELLSEIKVGKRRLGKVLSKKIYNCFFI